MALLILAFVVLPTLVIPASMPVSVHYGEDATFSWSLPALAQGQLVRVVNPHEAPVLDWAPDCTVTLTTYYANRVRYSCKDASRVTFTLLGVTRPDEGSYTCRGTSSPDPQIEDCGQNLTLVKVSPKVHIELGISDAVAMETEGKNLTLTCVVTEAFPPVHEDGYSWSYLPSPQGQPTPLVGKMNTLTLGPLTREDSGQYFCQAWNDQDNRWKILPGMASFALNTPCIDALLHSNISPQAVVEKDGDGYKAVFQLPQHPGLILVQHPNTYIITDWHRPCNFSVTEAFKERVTNTSCDPCRGMLTFSLVNATTRDLGWYQCYAGTTNGASIDSCSVELITQVATQVHIEPVKPDAVVKAAEGDRLTLTCVVTEAFPPVREDGYSWSYLPSPQGRLQPLEGKTNTLTLGPVAKEDSGQYFCQAWNDLTNGGKILPANASVTVDISYLGPIKSSSDLKVNERDHVTLTCSVDSKPTARLAWVVEGLEVRNVTGNEVHYVVERAACSDSKNYTCRASNPDLPDLDLSAFTILTVNCGQAPASDGHERWHTTIVVLVIIMPIMSTVALAVVAYLIFRRRSRKSSKKSPKGDPDEMEMEQTYANAPGPTEVEKSSEAVHNRTKLDGKDSAPLLGVEAVERAVSSSQSATTGATAEQPTEAVEMHEISGPQRTSLIDLKASKRSRRSSDLNTEVPSEADQNCTKPEEGETDRMLGAEGNGDTA